MFLTMPLQEKYSVVLKMLRWGVVKAVMTHFMSTSINSEHQTERDLNTSEKNQLLSKINHLMKSKSEKSEKKSLEKLVVGLRLRYSKRYPF